MSLKKWMAVIAVLALLLLGACSSKEKANEDADSGSKDKEVEQPENNEDDEAGNDNEQDDEQANEKDDEKTNEKASGDGAILNPYIAEETGGDVEVVFTNTNPGMIHHYSDEVSMSIDEYQIVHVSNMNESAKYNFDDEEEGYVLTLKMTLDNQSSEAVNYADGMMINTDDGMDYLKRKSHFVNRDEWLKDDSTEGASQYSSGKSFTGMFAYAMTKAQYEKLQLPMVKIDALWKNDDTSDRIGDDGYFPLPVNDAGLEKAKAVANLYPDKMVTDSIADKELIFAKEDINETQEFEGIKVTLHGVQYADVTPTEAHAERFTNFGDNGLVAITAKYTIENGSDVAFYKFLISSKLHIDDRGPMLSQGMLEPTVRGSVEPGEKFEGLTVFLFRADEFGIFKEFQLEIGPLSDENAKRLYKEKTAKFQLPTKDSK